MTALCALPGCCTPIGTNARFCSRACTDAARMSVAKAERPCACGCGAVLGPGVPASDRGGTAAQRARIAELWDRRPMLSAREIGRELAMSKGKVGRIVKALGLPARGSPLAGNPVVVKPRPPVQTSYAHPAPLGPWTYHCPACARAILGPLLAVAA